MKTVIKNKGRSIKRSLSSSSVLLKENLKKRLPSISPRRRNKDKKDDESSLKDPKIVSKTLHSIFNLVVVDDHDAFGDHDDTNTVVVRCNSNDSSRSTDDEAVPAKDDLVFLPAPRLYLCLMALFRSKNAIHKVYPPENSFVDNWDDDNEVERVQLLLDFCHWAECIAQGQIPKVRKFYQPRFFSDGDAAATDMIDLTAILRPLGYKLISKRASVNDKPGLIHGNDEWKFGYFIAVHHDRKDIVISIGSNSKSKHPSGIARTIVKQQQHGSVQPLYTQVAKSMLEDIGHLVDNFFIPLSFKVCLVGHSISAGVACRLGIILKKTRPLLRLHVFAFGPPACISSDEVESTQDFITSIVNNNDWIPRMSIVNLRCMMGLLERTDAKLKRWTLRPADMRTARKYCTEIEKLNAELFLTAQELSDFYHLYPDKASDRGYCNDKTDLVTLDIPGRAIFLWNHTQDTAIIGATVCTDQSSHASPQTAISTDDFVLNHISHKKFMVDSTIFYDHTYVAYKNNLELLIEQKANTI
jgi:hypothetical protein